MDNTGYLSSPNKTAVLSPAWLNDCAKRVKKILNFSYDDGDSGSNKYKLGYCGAYGGVKRSLRLARVWSLKSYSPFCVGACGRNIVLAAVKMFSHLVCFMKKKILFLLLLSKRCAVIILQYIVIHFDLKGLIPVNFYGLYALYSRMAIFIVTRKKARNSIGTLRLYCSY
jgi:hypothetical protein